MGGRADSGLGRAFRENAWGLSLYADNEDGGVRDKGDSNVAGDVHDADCDVSDVAGGITDTDCARISGGDVIDVAGPPLVRDPELACDVLLTAGPGDFTLGSGDFNRGTFCDVTAGTGGEGTVAKGDLLWVALGWATALGDCGSCHGLWKLGDKGASLLEISFLLPGSLLVSPLCDPFSEFLLQLFVSSSGVFGSGFTFTSAAVVTGESFSTSM